MSTINEPSPPVLLSLFIGHLKSTLMQQAIDAIRPAIRDAVDAAVAELAPAVQTYLDHLGNQMVVQIATKEIPSK